MEQYIRKSAVVSEIRKYIKSAEAFLKYHHNRNDKSVYASEQEKLVMCELLSFIDTLEVKEVDLQSEIEHVWDNTSGNFLEDGWKEFEDIAKHFYELGLKAAQNERKSCTTNE